MDLVSFAFLFGDLIVTEDEVHVVILFCERYYTLSTGTVKYATRTFSSINPEISDEDLLAVGQGLGALQSHDVGDIQRLENATMITG